MFDTLDEIKYLLGIHKGTVLPIFFSVIGPIIMKIGKIIVATVVYFSRFLHKNELFTENRKTGGPR